MTLLYPYQGEVLPYIADGQPTYLGFDPGLGKSRTAIEGAKARGVKSLLIIAPASGRYVWERECKLWWPGMPFAIIRTVDDLTKHSHSEGWRGIRLITYGLLSQKNSPFAAAVSVGKAWDMTVLDEAAYLKNSGANRTRAVLGKMLPKLGYVLPMSGTPAPNHAGELYTILKALYPQALKVGVIPRNMLEFEFQDAFCRVTQRTFGRGGPPIRVIEGSKNLPELRRRMDGFMRRVKKEDVMKDLPPIRWDVIPVQATQDLSALPAIPGGLTDDEVLRWLATGGEHVMRIRHMIGASKVPAAVEYIDDFLTNAFENQKVLVFAHHKDVIAALSSGLGNYKPAVITGETSPERRKQNIDMFLTDSACRVFVGNIQAAGTAITLVGPRCKCSDVFFVEADYSVGNNVQAACRVHRIGQKDGVVARFLTAHGTIDDRIQDILARKASDFDQLFN